MPLLMAIIGAWAAVHFGLVPSNQTRAEYIAYVLPFAIAFMAYVVYQVLRAPYVLDREQRAKIAELEGRIRSDASDGAPAAKAQTVRVPFSIISLLTIAIVIAVTIIALTAKRVYDQFPNPLSPAQMSDLADRLRNESPQKVMIVRKGDWRSVALAEQFRKILESAHWVLVMPPRSPSSGVVLIRGLAVWHAPTDSQTFVFSRALRALGLPYQVFTDIEMTNAGYFELTISDGWLPSAPSKQVN